MRIDKYPVGSIRPNEWNPNEMEAQVFKSLVESIRRHGVLQPILLRDDMTIIKGEKRWKAAQQAGISELLCVVVESSDEEAKLLNISLTNLRGKTNEELLASLVVELSQHFSISDLSSETGFSNESLTKLIETFVDDTEHLAPIEDDDFDVENELNNIVEPITKRGDIWALGRHRLMCGDSTSKEEVMCLMNGCRANLVVTDPPYNVAVESTSSRLAADGRSIIMNDDMPADEFVSFLHAVFQNYSEVMEPTAAIYVFHPCSYQREFEDAMNVAGIEVRTQCIWVKNAATFGWAQYRFKHEPVFYAHLKGKAPAWYGDRTQTTVWKSGLPAEEPIPDTVWEVSRGDVTKYVHPTQKPLELLAIPIKNSSKPGDEVVDFFGGSGSTLIACEKMNRNCYSMELDPKFCDVIVKRYKDLTGTEPELIPRLEKIK
ncbi:ParB N-terminal domain-containing protein [Paenibacillus sp. KQZ6P-2]|uniref:Methyltransferase n=1 Tax=Paenibacillus mangrovi TaxID=2931978 RepID=A0A9X2B5P8_9BACL|nr:DNA methyltransferase [Paenibacillus mangrovi]MCJ8015240.1 ParB N-terminal domain-containing protein [Paenibacillus mangrovi]